MNKWTNFWFAVCRQADGEGGGGAAGDVGAGGAEGGGVTVTTEAPASPASFISSAATVGTEGEAKPAEGAGTGSAKEGDKTEAPAAPEAFDAGKLTLPEGFTLPEETAKAFTDLLNNDKLTPQERGQQLLDLQATFVKDTVTKLSEQMVAANMETWTKMNETWRGEIAALPEFKADPEGEAGKIVQAAMAVGAGADFFAALDLTGAGNHPAIAQVLHRLAQPFIEGGAVGGKPNSSPKRNLGESIYTSANKT